MSTIGRFLHHCKGRRGGVRVNLSILNYVDDFLVHRPDQTYNDWEVAFIMDARRLEDGNGGTRIEVDLHGGSESMAMLGWCCS